MAKRGRKKTPVSLLNPRGESATARKKRTAKERKRYGYSNPCFIATAVYGDPWAPEVDALRRFRDLRLRPYSIWVYYRVSPPIADWLRGQPRIARIMRFFLGRIARHY